VRLARIAAALLTAGIALGCGAGPAAPSALDSRNDACAFCRMPVSDPRLAAQLASPSEEARFFDDIGCLRSYLAEHRSLPARSAAYVADRETGRWIAASRARYERCQGIETPMGSHLIAHDPAGTGKPSGGCEALSAEAVFAGTAVPDGGTR
jgi:copper chaperone NosL